MSKKSSISSLSLFLKRFWLRSPKYRARTLIILGIILISTLPTLIKISSVAWQSLAPRSPLGIAMRVPFDVCVDHLNENQRNQLVKDPHQVMAQLINPKLALVGIGESLVDLKTSQCQTIFRVGLLPQYAKQIARQGTQVAIALEAPSLTLLSEDLFHSERGKKLQKKIENSRVELTQRATALLPKLQERLTKTLDPDLASKLLNDSVVLDILKGAVVLELYERVNWEKIGDTIIQSPAQKELVRIAFQDVGIKEVIKQAFYGGYRELKQVSARRWTLSSLMCLMDRGPSIAAGNLVYVKSGSLTLAAMAAQKTRSFWNQDQDTCQELNHILNGALSKAAGDGVLNVAKQTFETIKKHPDETYTQAQKLLAESYEAAQGSMRLKTLWISIAGNQTLKDHILSHYGAPVWDQILNSTKELSHDPEVENLFIEASGKLKDVAQSALTALLLDPAGSGPNPLLLAVIQEQLSGKHRPIVRVTALGEGLATPEGYIFFDETLRSAEESK